MKNLKKALSLVLVIAMAFSLVTLASAKAVTEYSDASSVTYKEAVDTLTGLGILQGYEDNTFGPQKNITREQAAKIICYMLIGSKAADSLKTNATSFTDVDAARWSAPYIQYCVTKGIINGFGNKTFAPEANVTGVQFAKMLLTALGYGKNGEFIGDDWSINTLVEAQSLGILDTDVNYMDAATREEIAKYAFNTIVGSKCYFVALSNDLNSYIDLNKGTLASQQGITKSAAKIINGQSNYQWLKNGAAITGTWFVASTDRVLVTSSNGTKLSDLSNPASPSFKASADTTVAYYINGSDKDASNNAYDASDIEAICLVGVPVTLIDTNFNGKYDVVSAIVKNVLVLTGNTVVSATGAVTVPGIVTSADASKVTGYQDLVKGDYVLWYQDAATGVTHITKAAKLQGMLTSGTTAYATFAGSVHYASGLVSASDSKSLATFISSAANFNVPATAYVDEMGNILAISADSAAVSSYSYGLVVAYQHNGALTNSAIVKLIKQDGTVAIYNQAAELDGSVKDYTTNFALSASKTSALVGYTINSDGKIVIIPVTAAADMTNGAYAAKSGSITTDAGTYYISSATKLFYFDNSEAYGTANPGTVLVGYANSAAIADNTNVSYIVAPNSANVIDVLVIDGKATLPGSSNYAYAFAATPVMRAVNGTLVYDYTVYVNGQSKTLTGTTASLFGTGLFKYTVNAAGFVESTSQTTSDSIYAPTADGSVTDVDAGYIVYKTTASTQAAVLFTENTKFYSVSAGAVTAGTLAGSTDLTVQKILFYSTDRDGFASEVYFETTTVA